MITLGIETTTEVCAVGVVRGEEFWARSIREDRIHSEKLHTLIAEVLEEAGVAVTAVGCIGLSAGPGSFTGLRIGASAAKGLVAATGSWFIAVPTFEAIARTVRSRSLKTPRTVIALDARQTEWYVGVLENDEPVESVGRVPEGRLGSMIQSARIVTDAPDRFRGTGVSVHDVRDYCDGVTVARLAAEAVATGRRDAADDFEPLYMNEFTVRTEPKKDFAPRQAMKEK